MLRCVAGVLLFSFSFPRSPRAIGRCWPPFLRARCRRSSPFFLHSPSTPQHHRTRNVPKMVPGLTKGRETRVPAPRFGFEFIQLRLFATEFMYHVMSAFMIGRRDSSADPSLNSPLLLRLYRARSCWYFCCHCYGHHDHWPCCTSPSCTEESESQHPENHVRRPSFPVSVRWFFSGRPRVSVR